MARAQAWPVAGSVALDASLVLSQHLFHEQSQFTLWSWARGEW